jgi:hypothetical protein
MPELELWCRDVIEARGSRIMDQSFEVLDISVFFRDINIEHSLYVVTKNPTVDGECHGGKRTREKRNIPKRTLTPYSDPLLVSNSVGLTDFTCTWPFTGTCDYTFKALSM